MSLLPATSTPGRSFPDRLLANWLDPGRNYHLDPGHEEDHHGERWLDQDSLMDDDWTEEDNHNGDLWLGSITAGAGLSRPDVQTKWMNHSQWLQKLTDQ
jgi:hypothetical protein